MANKIEISNLNSTSFNETGLFLFRKDGVDYKLEGSEVVDYVSRNKYLSTTGTLSQAQILELNTTPVVVITAPGEGKVIEVKSFVAEIIMGGDPYTTNTWMVLKAGESTQFETNILATNIEQGVKKIEKAALGTLVLKENSSIVISVDTGNPEDGDGVLNYYIEYRIMDLL
jgi:hypothetical protein